MAIASLSSRLSLPPPTVQAAARGGCRPQSKLTTKAQLKYFLLVEGNHMGQEYTMGLDAGHIHGVRFRRASPKCADIFPWVLRIVYFALTDGTEREQTM